ncbi:MAG: hypothetical protein Mars2KO_39840 [Maribacter sp.]
MKEKIILIIVLTLFACNEKNTSKNEQHISKKSLTEQKSKSLDSLLLGTKKYSPNVIDISKSEFLGGFDLEYIFRSDTYSSQKALKDEIVYTLLLKQYLFHLKRGNQGHDLKPMMKGNAEVLISYFLEKHNIDSSLEFINSGVAYNILKEKHDIDEDLRLLVKDIQIEVDRINNRSN